MDIDVAAVAKGRVAAAAFDAEACFAYPRCTRLRGKVAGLNRL